MINFSTHNQQDAKSYALREALLEQMQAETKQFTALLEEYSERDPDDEALTQRLCQEIIDVVDRVLVIEGWESSLFLRNLMKPLIEAKEQARERLEQMSGDSAEHEKPLILEDHEQLLYMTLYQAQGHDLAAWALQLKSIKHTMLGRPLYDNEEAAKAKIRSKVDQSCDAYVVLRVNRDHLMDLPKSVKRSANHSDYPVVMLEQACLSVDNIVELHYMKKVYVLKQGRLIQK